MKYVMFATAISLVAACGSRADECEVEECSESVISACKDAVRICESSPVLAETCITAQLDLVKSCEESGDDS